MKSIKIKFMGRIYKIRKFRLILVPRIQLAHKLFLVLKNIFILKWRRRRKWKFFFFSKPPIEYIVYLRYINLYTSRGFWSNFRSLQKKKKVKNN